MVSQLGLSSCEEWLELTAVMVMVIVVIVNRERVCYL